MNNVQREIMLIAAEECAEVTQMVSKCLRFGLESCHPQEVMSNRSRLAVEIGDLFCMVDLLAEQGLIDINTVYEASRLKREKLKTWSSIFEEDS